MLCPNGAHCPITIYMDVTCSVHIRHSGLLIDNQNLRLIDCLRQAVFQLNLKIKNQLNFKIKKPLRVVV